MNAPTSQTGKVFSTMFSNAGVNSVSDGSVHDASNIIFNPDIPTPAEIPVGIDPIEGDSPFTIRTIEADGTSRYFDLQGRMLSSKPQKGFYIDKGKKIITYNK